MAEAPKPPSKYMGQHDEVHGGVGAVMALARVFAACGTGSDDERAATRTEQTIETLTRPDPGASTTTTAAETTTTTTAATTTTTVHPVPTGPPAPMPEPRTEVAGTEWNGRIVGAGGFLPDGSGSPRVDVYDPATNQWSPLPPPPELRHQAALGTIGRRVYVVGGYSGSSVLAIVFSLGERETSWWPEPTPRAGRERGTGSTGASAHHSRWARRRG